MKISNNALNNFVELYRKKYGVSLDKKEAMELALRYIRLIKVVESNKFLTAKVK